MIRCLMFACWVDDCRSMYSSLNRNEREREPARAREEKIEEEQTIIWSNDEEDKKKENSLHCKEKEREKKRGFAVGC